MIPPGSLERVTLETSLKPFKDITPDGIRGTCREVFRQWSDLLAIADRCAIMLWVGDGSELYNWRGNLDDPIEWARYIGFCNTERAAYPPGYQPIAAPYMPDPPTITYRVLRDIIAAFKAVGREEFDLDVSVGATIDPGPEFVVAHFKYERHPELIRGWPNDPYRGTVAFLSCRTRMQADDFPYAAFPDGAPEGLGIGAFLGRQMADFLPKMGFDYLWLSNGFGFSDYPWYLVGDNFDGQRFGLADAKAIADDYLTFWRELNESSGGVPLEVRGTNFPVGVDVGADCTPMLRLYEEGLLKIPPVNPPWGSRDLGMEMAAHMSRIAHLPAGRFAVRHYINDPWFYANPWWDYYNREPFDIYCPWTTGRINAEGDVEVPASLELLTIDTESGDLNEETAIEAVPHMRRAVKMAPDAPGPLVWVYPFREYEGLPDESPAAAGLAFFGDLFVRCAIQNGLPLNTVISTENLMHVMEHRPEALRDSILLAPAPRRDWTCGSKLIEWVEHGGQVLLYGPLNGASPELLGLLGLSIAEPLDGDLRIEGDLPGDEFATEGPPRAISHRPAVSGGGVCEVAEEGRVEGAVVHVAVRADGRARAYVVERSLPEWRGGKVAWVRGSLPLEFAPGSARHRWDSPAEAMDASIWLRHLLARFGYVIRQSRHDASSRCAYLFISRNDNGFLFTGHKPDATVTVLLRFPQGAPLLTERETRLRDGMSQYHLDRSFQHECRLFVTQEAQALLGVKEQQHPAGTARRLLVTGLHDARLTVYPSAEAVAQRRVEVEGAEHRQAVFGDRRRCVTLEAVTGALTITW